MTDVPPPLPDPWEQPSPTAPPPAESPYGPAPYGQQWVPPYPPPPAGTDGFAIAALVLGIVPVCLGLLGIVFGFVALSRIKRSGQSGRGLAIGGICTAFGWIAIVILAVSLGALADDEPQRDGLGAVSERTTTSVSFLRTGDCLATVPTGFTKKVVLVPCEEMHAAEAYHVYDLPAGPYAGDESVSSSARRVCNATLDSYVGTPDGKAHWDVVLLKPEERTWEDDRGVVCLLVATDRELVFGSAAGRGPGPGATPAPSASLLPGQVTGSVSPSDLVVGNCVTSRLSTGSVSTLDLGPCAKPHYGEVFSVYTMPAGPFPGEDESAALVEGHCRTYLPGFVGVPAGRRTGYSYYYFYPRAEDWADGDRVGTCLLEDPDDKQLTGEAKGHGRHR